MLRASVNAQILHLLTTQRTARNHPLDCLGQNALWVVTVEDLVRLTLLDPARVAGVPVVGLGLALVQRFVREHHGVVTVRSQLGEGTTLVVSIPEASARRDGQRMIVAVLENEDEAAPMFEAVGAEVKRFQTARQLLSFLGTSTLDLIVVDFLVKDMPFDAFMEGLAVRNEGPDVPVVMITRMTDSFISHNIRIHGYLSRPIQRGNVEALVTQLEVARRHSLEEQV